MLALKKSDKLKLFNDPIYGFISIQDPLIFSLVEHPVFQRLRRISQMGLSFMVFPGAHHTRFHHALGCLHLMQKAVRLLRLKSVAISKAEEQALYVAILLHDIGHGPFSHALESALAEGVHHEQISLRFMQQLNDEYEGQLSLAIEIFTKKHPKKFLCELVSGQIDIDRMDYLKRDSFYAGIPEGNINSDRIISMFNVKNNELVIEEKGLYSVEKFLMARRFMYWQAYLHKTGVAAELMLINILKRAKYLARLGQTPPCSESLQFFLNHSAFDLDNPMVLNHFAQLDDVDILSALKIWKNHTDPVLGKLSDDLLKRKLFKMKLSDQPVTALEKKKVQEKIMSQLPINGSDIDYFAETGNLSNLAYSLSENSIKLIDKKQKVKLLSHSTDASVVSYLTAPIDKYYLCYLKVKG